MTGVHIFIKGAVQGVGFRPFIYRLARTLGIRGTIRNTSEGVTIEAEAAPEVLEEFQRRICQEKPALSLIEDFLCTRMEPAGAEDFTIAPSDPGLEKTTFILPDIATCPECLGEILDRGNRRFHYPFTNCTHCGPRYSIIEELPYDRTNTSMKRFLMCSACREEYENPMDRRFHAQPNACPVCGPHLELTDHLGKSLAMRHEALGRAVEAVKAGKILALKGLGGFHLIVDARNAQAVLTLRERKHRWEKPLAVMVSDLTMARQICEISEMEQQLLTSPQAPIVLLRKRNEKNICDEVAPENPHLGVMLPYTPLHHVLLNEIGGPVVATSGNLSDEPICIGNDEALERLGKIADVFLTHNRPIVRQVDDSVAREMAGRPFLLRRARGYAPFPVALPFGRETILGVGSHLKNTVALSVKEDVFISQHIGDLDNAEAFGAFTRTVQTLRKIYDQPILKAVRDLHPDYMSSQYAEKLDIPTIKVQHHHAHIAACMADNGLDGEVLGVAWDGTGLGTDGAIWGGEFLLAGYKSFRRYAALRSFPLVGGDIAVKEPRRSGLGVLWVLLGRSLWEKDLPCFSAFKDEEKSVLTRMLEAGGSVPRTTSAGRLFDAVAFFLEKKARVAFEGQAAMLLEFAADPLERGLYPFDIVKDGEYDGVACVDWMRMVSALLDDIRTGEPRPRIAAKFHNTLIEMIVAVAGQAGNPRVCLSGGCFQNRRLLEGTIKRLREEGLEPYWHNRVPTNDGGISLGQVVVAAHQG